MEPRPGPSRAWYWVAGAVALAGVVGAVVAVVGGIVRYADEVEDFQRVAAPGQGVVSLEAGDHRLYWEPAFGPLEPVPLLGLEVDGPAGAVVDTSVRRVTYEVSGHRGIAIAEVDAPADGDYVIRSQGAGIAEGYVAVGDDPGFELFVGIGVGVLALLLAAAIAGTIVGIVAVRRHQAYWAHVRGGAVAPATPATAGPAPPPPPSGAPPAPPPPQA